MTRDAIAGLIVDRLKQEAGALAEEFRMPGRVQSCVIDDLLPEEAARAISAAFPPASAMREAKGMREHKFTAKQLDRFAPVMREITLAFQEPAVLRQAEAITGLTRLEADPDLYAGGLSLMTRGNFLLPHLDNSHDKDRRRYRVLNLLYYVSPGWTAEDGGNLELWDHGTKQAPREIVSRFNRLVLMATHQRSWHSVNQVVREGRRACISNYYFSPEPLEGRSYFHVTSFRGRPGQPGKDLLLRVDSALRNAVRKIARRGIYKPEIYRAGP